MRSHSVNDVPCPEAVIGIDPGKGGYLCLLSLSDGPVQFQAMPVIKPAKGKSQYDVSTLVAILRKWASSYNVRLVVIEKQQAYPGQGGSSNFTIGYGYGLLMGITAALGLPAESPHPRTWQSEMLRDVPGSDLKVRSIQAAGRLFPKADLRTSEHPLAKANDGRSDSLLLAAFGRRKLVGPAYNEVEGESNEIGT